MLVTISWLNSRDSKNFSVNYKQSISRILVWDPPGILTRSKSFFVMYQSVVMSLLLSIFLANPPGEHHSKSAESTFQMLVSVLTLSSQLLFEIKIYLNTFIILYQLSWVIKRSHLKYHPGEICCSKTPVIPLSLDIISGFRAHNFYFGNQE